MEDVLKLVFRDSATTVTISLFAILPLGVAVLFVAYWTFEKICDTAVRVVHGHPPAPTCSCQADDGKEEKDDNRHTPKGFAKL